MSQEKLIAKGPFLDKFKDKTDGLKIANELKDLIIDYFEGFLDNELEKICKWAIDITNLQNKRTLQEKDWEFILSRIIEK